MLQIGWFTTARGEGSRNLFTSVAEQIVSGDLPAQISVVFCNRERGEAEATDAFFDLVVAYGVPLVTLSSVRFRKEHGGERSRPSQPLPAWRRAYDREVVNLLAPYRFDIGVLAGYMLIVTEELCDRYPLLNLHPAAPGGPEGVWQEVIWQLIEQGATHSGVQIQRVTLDVDRGPVVTYCLYPIRGADIDPLWAAIAGRDLSRLREAGENLPLFREIRRRGMVREAPLLVETLRAFAEGRLRLVGHRVFHGDRELQEGLDLTAEVEHAVAAAAVRQSAS